VGFHPDYFFLYLGQVRDDQTDEFDAGRPKLITGPTFSYSQSSGGGGYSRRGKGRRR
jgi:hypothetical protein